jgi:hypothetical protein
MPLVLQSQPVNLVNDNDLVSFITQAYGLQKPYEFVATEEFLNGGYKLFDVEAEPLDTHEQRKLETLKIKGYCQYVTDIVLRDLCNKGWLEPGVYLVPCSW